MNKFIGIIIVSFFSWMAGCSNGIDATSLKKFGDEEFSGETWNSASAERRSKMVYSFIEGNSPIQDLTRDQIIEQLGDSTSYFQYDEFPAYELRKDDELFTLAFVIDRDTAKVKSIELEKMP